MDGSRSTQFGYERLARIPYWRFILDQCSITQEVQNWPYEGSGTHDRPYIIDWIHNDVRNPVNIPTWRKWVMVAALSISLLAVSFVSSSYVGGIDQIKETFEVNGLVASLGVALYVLGFALGPILWAPLSEVYGRQPVFVSTYGAMTLFNIGAIFSQNIETLLLMRLFAGTFGACPLTNTGGFIADIFSASERGLAMNLFAIAPFMGPVQGPIVGGFLGQAAGWKWVMVLSAVFCGVCWVVTTVLLPETFSPLLLRKRADKLSRLTGKSYISHFDAANHLSTSGSSLRLTLTRPWLLLVFEPIVTILTIYMSIIYGTLYMMFGAFPFVFQEARGWSQGANGLAFLGILVGLLLGVGYNFLDNKRYTTYLQKSSRPSPEARLPPMMVGALVLPIGLFWFAWTNYPSIHWMSPITASGLFGFSLCLVFVSGKNYLVDSYRIFSASALASTVIVRSLFGMAFPLFTPFMFHNLGVHWASSIPAFLGLACTPFPFLFYRYGSAIRERCPYAHEAAELSEKQCVARPSPSPVLTVQH